MKSVLVPAALLTMLLHPMATNGADRVALILGNRAYPGNPDAPDATPGKLIRLDSVADDVRLMSSALGKVGFTVESHQDLTAAQMKQSLLAFQQKYNGTREVLFYFSGHGAQVGGENYLTGIDSDANLERETLELEAQYSGDELRERLEKIEGDAAEKRCLPLRQVLANLQLMTPSGITELERSHHVRIVILDACRSPFNTSTVAKGVVFKKGGLAAADTLKRAGVFIGFAAAANEVSLAAGAGHPSLFTQHFAERLQQPGDIGTVFKEARLRVNKNALELAGIRQFPAYYDELEANFSFVSSATPAPGNSQPVVANPPPSPSSHQIPETPKTTGPLSLDNVFGDTSYASFNGYSRVQILKKVQEKLKSKGAYQAEPDGKMGKLTAAAILQWQRDNNLRTTGLLDTDTQKSLGVTGFVETMPPAESPPQPSETYTAIRPQGPQQRSTAVDKTWKKIEAEGLLKYFNPPSNQSAAALKTGAPINQDSVPMGEKVPGMPGYARSPHVGRLVDVKGMPSGSKVICPYTQRPFVVP